MTKIYYWHGAFSDPDLIDSSIDTIKKILKQDYAPSDLEKLNSNNSQRIYSFRVNIQGRLLFTTLKIANKSYLLVLEYITDHNYKRSRFLGNDQVLKNYCAKFEGTFIPEQEDLPKFENLDEISSNSFTSLDYFNNKYIEIKVNQSEVVHAQLPLILNGVGGSGKTYTAFNIIRKFIEDYDLGPKSILYVTNEDSLIRQLEIWWQNFNGYAEDSRQVEFLTYAELLKQSLNGATIVHNCYDDWFNNQKHYSNKITYEIQYQEFRICSALTQQDYLELANKNLTREEREAIYQQFELFQEYLETTPLIDLVFKSFKANPKYRLIIVDEAQNFSLCQLKNIHQLAINSQVLYCMDPQQNIYDNNAIRKLFKQLFWSEQSGLQIKTINLDKTYRCAKKIVETINVILAAKHKIMAKIDKEEADNLLVDESGEVGYVALTSPKKLHEYQEILDRYSSPEFAVVTHETLVAEARNIFKTPLVFTIQQIQGLDYHTVVIYRLFPKNKSISQESKNIFNLLKADQLTQEDKNTNITYAAWFHQLYTAFTRAKHTLLIIEENSHQNPIYKMLNATFDKAQNTIQATLNQDWDSELEKQKVKNPSVAKQIEEQFSQNPKKQKIIAEDKVLENSSLNPESKITKESYNSQSSASKITDEKIEDKNLLVAKAKSIYENFTRNAIINEISKKYFHELLFATKFCLDTKKEHEGKTLFARIIENEGYAFRFAVTIGAYKLVDNDEFILRIIDYKNTHKIITEKLMEIIFTKNFRVFTDEKISDWIDKEFVASKIAKNKIATDIIKIAHSLWLDEFLGFLKQGDKPKWHFPKAFAEIIITSASEDCSNTPLYILTKYPKGLEILDYLIKIDNVIDNIPIDAWHFPKNYHLTETLRSTPFINLTKTEQAISIFEKLIDKKKEIIEKMDPKYWGLVYLDNINFNSLLNNLVTSDKGLEILSKLINESVIKKIPLYAWGTVKISFGQFDNICISPLDYLRKLSEQEDSANLSVTKVESAKKILEILVNFHGDNFFFEVPAAVIKQNLTSFSCAQKKLSNIFGDNFKTNITETPPSQEEMIEKAKQIYSHFNKRIDSEKNRQYFHKLLFETEFFLENDGLYKTLFARIISNETYVNKFALSLTAYPQNKFVDFIEKAMEYEDLPPVIIKKLIHEIFTNNLFVFIKREISSWIDKNFDHLITEQGNIADYLINNSREWLNFFEVMTQTLPIKDFFFPKAFSKILCSKGKTTLFTPLYRLTEDDVGLRVLSFLIDFPDVIDNIDVKAWHDVASGADKPELIHKTPFYNLSKNESALLVFDKFISKRYEIIKNFPLKEWGSLFSENGKKLGFCCVLENLVIYDTGLKILSKLLDYKDSLVVESEFLYYWRYPIKKVIPDGVAGASKYGFFNDCYVFKSPFEHLLEYADSSNALNELPEELQIKAKLATQILAKLNQIAMDKKGLTFAELSQEAYDQHVKARDNTSIAKI